MNQSNQPTYTLLDSRNIPLAYGVFESSLRAPEWEVRVLDNRISEVMKREDIQLVSLEDQGSLLLGRILRNRGDVIILQKIQVLGSEMRTNLRMPVHFKSFIYPLSGEWIGRFLIEANDLSCGGLAFYCDAELEKGEIVEVVIPITAQPLILQCEILRRRPSDRSSSLYAGRFVNQCHDEEVMVRAAVFRVPIQHGLNETPRNQ